MIRSSTLAIRELVGKGVMASVLEAAVPAAKDGGPKHERSFKLSQFPYPLPRDPPRPQNTGSAANDSTRRRLPLQIGARKGQVATNVTLKWVSRALAWWCTNSKGCRVK